MEGEIEALRLKREEYDREQTRIFQAIGELAKMEAEWCSREEAAAFKAKHGLSDLPDSSWIVRRLGGAIDRLRRGGDDEPAEAIVADAVEGVGEVLGEDDERG